jgi:acyl carrier protein
MVATAADLSTINPHFGNVPLGRVIANVKAYVLDRFGHPVRIGVPGELYVGGAALARGYLNRPELTAEKFLPNPFEGKPGARLFRTGDIVRYLPNGELDFVKRSDRQVKIHGFRVELAEIEKVLTTSSAVRQAVVVAHEDRPGDKRLLGYVVLKDSSSLDCRQINEFLRRRLPGHMILSALVILDALPTTVSGRVDLRALPALPASSLERMLPLEEPAGPVERQLAELWAQVLGVETVSPHDNFFEMGGHSLLATRLVSRLRSTFGVEFALRSLFEKPTVREMARVIVQMKLDLPDPEDISKILTALAQIP